MSMISGRRTRAAALAAGLVATTLAAGAVGAALGHDTALADAGSRPSGDQGRSGGGPDRPGAFGGHGSTGDRGTTGGQGMTGGQGLSSGTTGGGHATTQGS